MSRQLIAQGAEAKVFLENNQIKKARLPKSYRHPVLDEQIRRQRNKRESRILTKALALNINVPKVLNANEKGEPRDKFELHLEFVEGDKLATSLNDYPQDKQYSALQLLGKQVALLHQNNIIHSDLTTSNMILSNDTVFLIDFGLGFISTKIEDKAVDLHVLKEALEAKHFQNHEELFKEFLTGYQFDESDKVLQRLTAVERRGRYKKNY